MPLVSEMTLEALVEEHNRIDQEINRASFKWERVGLGGRRLRIEEELKKRGWIPFHQYIDQHRKPLRELSSDELAEEYLWCETVGGALAMWTDQMELAEYQRALESQLSDKVRE